MNELGFGISYVGRSGEPIAYSGGCLTIEAAKSEAHDGLLNIYPQATHADIHRGSMRPEGQPVERVTR